MRLRARHLAQYLAAREANPAHGDPVSDGPGAKL